MIQFLKFTLASALGFILAGFLGIMLTLLILGGITAAVQKPSGFEPKPNSILRVRLDRDIPERTIDNPFNDFDYINFRVKRNLGLDRLLNNIRKARKDEDIKGIYLELNWVPAGWATLEAIRNELLDFKTSGKFIIAYSNLMTQRGYFMSSVADSIFLNPSGYMDFSGFDIRRIYLAGALDKLGIRPEVFYAGKFKSATEMVRLKSMSKENRIQITEYLESFYNLYLNAISGQIGISSEELFQIADQLLIRHASDAVEQGLVDKVMYQDEVYSVLRELMNEDPDTKLNIVSMLRYDRAPDQKIPIYDDKIAVIYAEGEIKMGRGTKDEIGERTFAKAIRKARRDSKVKAIVLRVNSPGGAALASDIIWRELVLAKQEKPLVVSMGDYAASGGYYIACMADKIFAEPTTLTGSIGVFAMIFNTEEFWEKKLGITYDGVKITEFSDIGSSTRPMTDIERKIIQAEVDYVYEDFLDRVAEGRGMSRDEVDEIAQGRIWIGTQAKKLGLVDEIGGLEEAIAAAAELADTKEYSLIKLPRLRDPILQIIEDLSMSLKESWIKEDMEAVYPAYQALKNVMSWQGIQTRLPYSLEIE